MIVPREKIEALACPVFTYSFKLVRRLPCGWRGLEMHSASSTGDCAEPRDCNRTPEEVVKYNKWGEKREESVGGGGERGAGSPSP